MIGILGGTFDPVHYGHLRPALDVQTALEMFEVRFIPCNEPAHRDAPLADVQQRLSMLRAALRGNNKFVVDDREIKRGGVSYMVDTLMSLRQQFPAMPLGLILGMDAFAGLASWRDWQKIIELAHLVVTHRPGWGIEQLQADEVLMNFISTHQVFSADDLQNDISGNLYFQPITQLDISATHIRKLCRQGKSIQYLLPEAVRELIQQQGIYS